jgi:hypothetical protein
MNTSDLLQVFEALCLCEGLLANTTPQNNLSKASRLDYIDDQVGEAKSSVEHAIREGGSNGSI